MSVLRVNKILDEAGTGPVSFPQGVEFPEGTTFPEPIINTTGIVTATTVDCTTAQVAGVTTATSFFGNGYNMTNVPGTPSARVIALYLIS